MDYLDQVLHGDCLSIMRSLPTGSIDCLVTDPPYCSGAFTEAGRKDAKCQGLKDGKDWFVGDNMGTAGLVWLLREVAFEGLRLLKDGTGSMLFFCDWRMMPNLAPAIESAGLKFQNVVVWDKKGIGMGQGFRPRHEMILHYTAGVPKYHDKATGNIITAPRVAPAKRDHPTQKPVELIAQLLRVVCPSGGVALDPFGGSGTLAEAARASDRHFVCIERSADFCEAAEQRLEHVQADLI